MNARGSAALFELSDLLVSFANATHERFVACRQCVRQRQKRRVVEVAPRGVREVGQHRFCERATSLDPVQTRLALHNNLLCFECYPITDERGSAPAPWRW